jgi:hypothetical protein
MSDFKEAGLSSLPDQRELTTSCRDCVFATKHKKTQTGCSLGRLEKFEEQNVEIIYAKDEEDNEFAVLKGWCSAYRNDIWKTAHKEEDLEEALDNEIYPKINFVVLVKDNLNEIEMTINSILNQERFKAAQIIIVTSNDNLLIECIQKSRSLLEDSDVLFKVQAVRSDIPNLAIVDEVFANFHNGFYSIFECGKEVPKDLISVLHSAINTNVEKVGYVKPHDGINGMTVQCVLHKFLYGNKGASLEEKLLDGEDMDKTGIEYSLVRTWDELR